MDNAQSLCHSKWECKYHIVWIPKGRRKTVYGRIRKDLGDYLHSLARQKECKILEGHLQPDHIHILISIPPKYSVAQIMGFLKGKSAIHIARTYLGQRKNATGMHFWARGYFVSTVGTDEAVIREYIRNQEQEDKRVDQLSLLTEG
jgi:putative transposase